MADITWDDVVLIAPELSTTDSDAQDLILAYVNEALAEAMFKANALKLARINLAAHMGTGVGLGMAAGPVISETEGGLSRTYAAPVMSSDLASTSYGRNLAFLFRTSKARMPVVLR